MELPAQIDFDRNPPIATSDYDKTVRMVLPGYEAMQMMGLSVLKSQLPSTANLLVVGAGTGIELIKYAQSCPEWQMLGVDPSADMLAIAQSKIQQHQYEQRIKLVTGYTQDLPTTTPYDAATSILVMHFIPDDGAKLEFLQAIAARLQPSANLILVDVFGDKNTPEFTTTLDYIKHYWQEMGLPAQKSEELIEIMHHSVYPIPETRLFDLFTEAGFTLPHRFYTGFWVGGWVAKKI